IRQHFSPQGTQRVQRSFLCAPSASSAVNRVIVASLRRSQAATRRQRMKVLVIGKGGREHALVWKIAQSPRVERVYCAPGNAGTAMEAVNVSVEANDLEGLLKLARKEEIDLTVVGPEEPLAAGIVDLFQKEGRRIFGPTRQAAELEASKVFAKRL